jgi:UPF0755 protein
MFRFLRRIILLAIVAILVAGIWFLQAVFTVQSDDSTEQTFTIATGEGVNEISGNLRNAGIIKSSLAFETYVWLIRSEGRLIAGDYALTPDMTLRDLTRRITSGDALSNEKTITILEGWTRQNIAEYLEVEGLASADAFLKATENQEGYLFPDTYRIFERASAEDIAKKLRTTFETRVRGDLAVLIDAQSRSFEDVIILASILEREVRSEEEMRIAADLFWRRLDIGMLMQADSTINFVTGGKNPSVSFADLEIDSPYNTYKYAGLPPGPIGNPGIKAIGAALDPLPNDNWFFLTTKDDGRAIFSKTLQEHNTNRQKHL